MATIKDVAKLAAVSVSTASSSLNGKKHVKPETRKRVEAAAKQLNYQKNGSASDLKKIKTNTLVLILDDLSGPFFSELIRGVQDVALSNGYDLITCSSLGGKNMTPKRFLLEKRSDGVVILAHNLDDETIARSARNGFPVVVLDRNLPHTHTLHIQVDNERGGYDAANYLLNLGHRAIAYISGPVVSYDNQERYKGFLKALSENGLTLPGKWQICGEFTQQGGYHATNMLLSQRPLPSAVFYANDEMAIGGLQAFAESGIKVPEDISIIGYDDILLSQYTTPPLTTIHQPKYQMGSLAAHLILQVLNGEELEQQSYTLQTQLIERESCRRVERDLANS
ncbi:LacI family DNA-binding transcriptional regulator [Desmospora activa]|uniref:LacI family transcriptional regulator n=1 Tax=Desmospora activa DSM 45169 TaxID=1121389 RepID=A0A2T4ZCY1_9BACL|nr:LacI family DNA-binding transcriptional regulator [Desmospora activa]PTM59736.1 LacI family transcriptional regulator [Desmospora activa DSM 45169]